MQTVPIRITQKLWIDTWKGLERRSSGSRESLCVWAGRRYNQYSEVTAIVFADEFDGVEGFALFHRIPRNAVNDLFAKLQKDGLQLIADVHTHPSDWVGLSETDQEHPLEYRLGFVSLVLPNYGKGPHSIETVGMHVYAGSLMWRTLSRSQVQESLTMR